MVEQPNQVSAGGQRLAFGYYHPGTSNFDTATWLKDAGYVRTLFFVIAPCSTETLDCICPPTLTPPMTLDPSSDGTKTAMLLLQERFGANTKKTIMQRCATTKTTCTDILHHVYEPRTYLLRLCSHFGSIHFSFCKHLFFSSSIQ